MKKITIIHLFLWVLAFTTLAQEKSDGKTFRKPGKLFSFTEVGILAGNADNQNSSPFIFHSSLNYTFFQNLSAGVGAGVEFFEETHMPLTGNLMYQFGNKKITPFAMFQAGYQIPLETKRSSYYMGSLNDIMWASSSSYWPGYSFERLNAKGGLMLNPSVGIIYYTESGLGISISAGYRYQKLHYKGNNDYKLDIEYNRLSLKLGLIF